MKFKMAFGIFEAECQIDEDYDPDTAEFADEIVARLKMGQITVIEVTPT